MNPLFRMLRRGLGLREFSRNELDLLADVYESRLVSWNHLEEHESGLYCELVQERLIYLEQFKKKDGSGYEEFGIPMGIWRLSPAAPRAILEMIQSHIATETQGGKPRVTARQRRALLLIEARRRLPVSAEARISVLWHLAHDKEDDLAPSRGNRPLLPAPPSIDSDPVNRLAWPTLRLSDAEIESVLDELLASQDLSTMTTKCKSWRVSFDEWAMWQVLSMNLHWKVKLTMHLQLADAFSQNREVLVDRRNRQRAETRRSSANVLLNDEARQAIRAALASDEWCSKLLSTAGLLIPRDGSSTLDSRAGSNVIRVESIQVVAALMEELDRIDLLAIQTAARSVGCNARLDERWHVWALPDELKMAVWTRIREAPVK